MGDITGFLKYDRVEVVKEEANIRKQHWNEFVSLPEEKELRLQASRCMDCGVPFCHNGCPVNNLIPDWNDLIFNGYWESAFKKLMKTNNFPEFTGRICPAPCENSCVLSINKPAVTIKNVELAIIEKAYSEGWMKPLPPNKRTGKKAAIIGSGPAGLACADQLNKAGHLVTVFEKNEIPGGLLMFGIPNFKLDKKIVLRRIDLMKEEGIEFRTSSHVGADISTKEIQNEFDAVVLSGGAEKPRDLSIEGRELNGIVFAMEFLTNQNRIHLGLGEKNSELSAEGKRVIVLGGGDTGSDCIGTAIRQGAASVLNFELLPKPPKNRKPENPWPQWAFIERTSSSHEEGCKRDFGVLTKKFTGSGKVEALHAVRVKFGTPDPNTGRKEIKEIPSSDFIVEADMVILALGFLGPNRNGLLDELGLKTDERGNVKTDARKMTSVEGVFAAGDMSRGQSLVVWAINEGRKTAAEVDKYLTNIG